VAGDGTATARSLATPATEKALPPEDLPPVDSSQRDNYLNRLRDLHQETLLGDEQIWSPRSHAGFEP
jgi:hypothetical protein